MFIELVDHLRCVQPHEESWLVLSADRIVERDVVAGTLGCPLCKAEYPIRDGAVEFVAPGPSAAAPAPPAPAPDEVLRAAALLGLAEPNGFVLLTGDRGALARGLLEAAQVHAVLLNPTFAAASGDGVSVVYAPAGAVPLAANALRAAALDAVAASDGPGASLAPRAAAALRGGGRLVAPAATPLPPGLVELARDEREWVAERDALTSAPVRLGLARRR